MNEKGLLLYEIEECQKKLDNIILKENKNKVDLLYEQANNYIGKYYLDKEKEYLYFVYDININDTINNEIYNENTHSFNDIFLKAYKFSKNGKITEKSSVLLHPNYTFQPDVLLAEYCRLNISTIKLYLNEINEDLAKNFFSNWVVNLFRIPDCLKQKYYEVFADLEE